MKTAGREVLLTNFAGGVNTHDDVQMLPNNQLTRGSNIIITRDGSIQNRNGIHMLDNVDSITGAKTYRLLGKYGDTVIFSTENTGTSPLASIKVLACRMTKFNPTSRAFINGGTDPTIGVYNTSIPVGTTTEGRIIKALPYVDSLILVHEFGFIRSIPYTSSTSLVYPGSSTTGTVPGVPTVSNKKSVVVWKDRLLFAANDGRIYYSAATALTDFSTVSGGGYFLAGNDATAINISNNAINQLLLIGDVLYIFKKESVYAFTFQTDPGVDGYLRVVSSDQGAQKAVMWNNRIFVADPAGVYEFLNGRFVPISTNMDLYVNSSFDCNNLFILDNYLVAVYNADCLCMNLLNGAWTHWNTSSVLKNSETFDVQSGPAGTHTAVFTDGEPYCLSYISTKAPKYDTTSVGTAGSVGNTGTPGTAHLTTPSFMSKMFTFESPWVIKKIYKIMIDRGGSYDVSPAPSQGWRVYYYNPDGSETVIPYASSDNRFGLIVVGGSFRCYHFRIGYDFSYSGTPAASFDFTINSMSITYKSGSDYTKSDGTFNK